MKLKISKPILLTAGILLLAGALMSFIGGKKIQIKEVFEQLRINLSSLHNLDISLQRLRFQMHLDLINPTRHDLNINTAGVVKLKVYRIKRNGELIASGHFNNLSQLNIPAGGRYRLSNIEVVIPIMQLLQQGSDIFSDIDISEMIRTKNLHFLKERLKNYAKELTYEIDIEVASQVVTISNNVINI